MIIGITGYTEDERGNRGSAGAGKDAIADVLVECNGFVKVALADPIKRIAAELWGWDEDRLWGPSANRNAPDERYPFPHSWKETGVGDFSWRCEVCGERSLEGTSNVCRYLTPRRALQQIGTEVGRCVDPDVWARYAVEVAGRLLTKPCRYDRERGVLPCLWGNAPAGIAIPDVRFSNEVLKVKEAGGKVVRIKRRVAEALPGEAATHESEVALLSWADSAFDYVLENNGALADLPAKIAAMLEAMR